MFLTRERAKSKLWTPRFLACALAGFFVVAHPADSRADVWQWLTDLVQTGPDIESTALSGSELPSDAIVTGGKERRVLRLGRDVLELYPSTAVTFDVSGSNTTVRLITGTLRAKVAKRKKGQTFDVQTRMLVATVKGTDFEVSAIGGASAVSVYEGRVAVKAAARVGGVDVTSGKTATVAGADREPTLGQTPPGGAAAAANALAGETTSNSEPARADPNDGGFDGWRSGRDVISGGKGASASNSDASNGPGGGSDSDGDGGDGEGGENGDDD